MHLLRASLLLTLLLAPLGAQTLSPRLQWLDSGGYCGEAALQTAALGQGLWVSQKVVRDLAGGEVLLGVNAERAARRLGLAFETWNPDGRAHPRLPGFLRWLEDKLRAGSPCLVAVLGAGGSHLEYDHICLATQWTGPPADGDLELHSLLQPTSVRRPAANMGATRRTCSAPLFAGGCLPEGTPYGLAILGPVPPPPQPVSLTLDRPDEPRQPGFMRATVRVGGLVPGRRYLLLRVQGLQPRSITQHEFIPTATEWTWNDPIPIPSRSLTRYHCQELEP